MKKLSFAVLAIIAVTGLGCGNFNNHPFGNTASKASYKFSNTPSDPFANNGYPEDKGYTCPSKANVVPASEAHSGYDVYTACISQSASSDFSLHGEAYTSRICIFPVQNYTNGTRVSKFDKNGDPLSQCIDSSTNAMHLSFPQTNFNAIYVAAESDKSQMNQCLNWGRFDLCPEGSGYGSLGPATQAPTAN